MLAARCACEVRVIGFDVPARFVFSFCRMSHLGSRSSFSLVEQLGRTYIINQHATHAQQRDVDDDPDWNI